MTVEEQIAALEKQVGGFAGQVVDIIKRLDEIEDDLGELSTWQEKRDAQDDPQAAKIKEMGSAIQSLQAQYPELERRLKALSDWCQKVHGTFTDLQGKVKEFMTSRRKTI
jgi:uncharacterized protein YoxC